MKLTEEVCTVVRILKNVALDLHMEPESLRVYGVKEFGEQSFTRGYLSNLTRTDV